MSSDGLGQVLDNLGPKTSLNIVSKIFEHILSSHITKHLEINNILHQQQHGFRHNRSCKTHCYFKTYL